MEIYLANICLIVGLHYVKTMDYTLTFKTLSDCSISYRNTTEWSQFDDIGVVSLDKTSIISHLTVSSEEFCIAACHANTSCVAVQVNTTSDGSVVCHLLSYTPFIGKVRNQTGVKLLLKGKRSVYNIDSDVSTQCNGLPGCATLIVDGNVYLTMTNGHFSSKSEARIACLNMSTPNGEFDLAITDSWSKISAVQSFLETLTTATAAWTYTGGEAGLGVNDTANKWTRTGEAIAPDLWAGAEPNLAHEHCVMVTESFNGLIDTGCDGQPTSGQDAYTLCEYFPD